MYRTINREQRLVSARLMSKVRAVIDDVDGHLPAHYRLAFFEGWRDPRDQAQLVKEGVSKTFNSKHCQSPARAADLMFQHENAAGIWTWVDWKEIVQQWKAWLLSAKRAHNVARAGLDWDSPHCELKS